MASKYPERNVNYLGQICIMWGMGYSYKAKEFVLCLSEVD